MKYLYLLKYKEIVLFQYQDSEDRIFWYEENTCVSNFLGETEDVFCLKTGDTDRHGIFKVEAIIPCDAEKSERIEHFMSCGSTFGEKDIKWLIDKIKSI